MTNQKGTNMKKTNTLLTCTIMEAKDITVGDCRGGWRVTSIQPWGGKLIIEETNRQGRQVTKNWHPWQALAVNDLPMIAEKGFYVLTDPEDIARDETEGQQSLRSDGGETPRWPVTVDIPQSFYDDHISRGCGESGEVLKVLARKYRVRLDEAAWNDLKSDCEHYCAGDYWGEFQGLVTSARGTLNHMAAVR